MQNHHLLHSKLNNLPKCCQNLQNFFSMFQQSPPMTSNLLSILTSSQTPAIDRNTKTCSPPAQTVFATVPTRFINVPHPDTESFQTFFTNCSETIINETISEKNGNCSEEMMNSVKRESDLLVMKKNVPILRRKSSANKSTRNPLKVLAARMDFRNQKYQSQ